MKKCYVLKIYDYTLKRKGDRCFIIVDENGNYLNFGSWKTKKACIEHGYNKNNWNVEGYVLQKEMLVRHQNYSHWANFEFAK